MEQEQQLSNPRGCIVKQNLILSLVFTFILAAGCQTLEPSPNLTETTVVEVVQVETSQSAPSVVPQVPMLGPSCADPTPETAVECHNQVEQILNATVRIELEYWSEGQPVVENGTTSHEVSEVTSHATLINQRYLITHNHFPISPRELKDGASGPQLRFSLYTLQGEAILRGASLRNFDVVAEWPETLVLDFRESGEVLFKAFGVHSMPVATTANTLLQAGTEVAQINWDGVNTWVEWVRVERVNEDEGVTQIVLNHGVKKGASGGGVFWNGQHIGNNWTTSEVRSTVNGEVIGTFSVAAFNVAMDFSG